MGVLQTALALMAAPVPAPGFVGMYEVDQMEMAGGLELRADGRFRYALEYGAVSEVSEGEWSAANGAVQLTTEPMPPKSECDRGFASACFNRASLDADGDDLILRRWDARIVFRPVQPRPR